MSAARPIFLAALTLAAFLGMSAVQRALVPWPTAYGLGAKMEWLEEHKDEYDVLFLGSSVTYYGLVPPVFDQVMAERGRPLRSFNLGVGGMMPIEADRVLQRFLAMEPARLKYVFVEANSWEGTLYLRDQENLFSPRMVHWHDVQGTLDAVTCLENAPAPPEGKPDRRGEDMRDHGMIFLRWFSAAGAGLRTLRRLTGLDDEELDPSEEELAQLHGYKDLDVIDLPEWDRRRAGFLGDLDGYQRAVSRVGKGNRQPVDVTRHQNLPGLERQIASIRAAGAEPIFYLGPRVASDPMAYALAEAGILPSFLPFNRPGAYPELYEPENHWDTNHLSRGGAELFTRLFAEAFADQLEGQE